MVTDASRRKQTDFGSRSRSQHRSTGKQSLLCDRIRSRMTVRRPTKRKQVDFATARCIYIQKTNEVRIKHPHSVKFCFHFKNGKFQRSSGSSKMQGVLFGKREEKRSSLIRLIRRTKKKSRTASSKYVKNTCIK